MQPAIMPHRLELTPVESALERIWFRLDKPMTEPSMSLTTPYDPQNIFAKIIRGEAPCYKLYEDEDVLAFLDLFPQSFGHTLVIPKRSAACNLLDVDTEALCKVMRVVQQLTQVIVDELQPEGVQVAQFNGAPAGQTVFHIHMHIVPRYAGQGLGVHAAKAADHDELEKLQQRLVQRVAASS
jgi:histidine triad (HIT) family protein